MSEAGACSSTHASATNRITSTTPPATTQAVLACCSAPNCRDAEASTGTAAPPISTVGSGKPPP